MSVAFIRSSPQSDASNSTIVCESPDLDYDEINEREYQAYMKRELKRPKWCYERCPQAQHCIRSELFQLEKFYEKCSEYWFLEELEADANK